VFKREKPYREKGFVTLAFGGGKKKKGGKTPNQTNQKCQQPWGGEEKEKQTEHRLLVEVLGKTSHCLTPEKRGLKEKEKQKSVEGKVGLAYFVCE